MTNKEAVNWIINLSADIGKSEHSELWHYEQALCEIKEILESAQQWIPATKSLPIEFLDRRILVSTVSPTGRKSVDIGLWEGVKWKTYFPIGDDRITAWMPLPDCYEEADE